MQAPSPVWKITETKTLFGDHTVRVASDIFKGKTIIDRHKVIYSALDSYIKSGEIHALTIKSLTIDESNKA